MPMYFKPDMSGLVEPQIVETLPEPKRWVLSDDGRYEVREAYGETLMFRWDGNTVMLPYREEPANNALYIKLSKDTQATDYQGEGYVREEEIEVIRRTMRDMARSLHRRIYFEE